MNAAWKADNRAWLELFFAAPNGLTWSSLEDGSAPAPLLRLLDVLLAPLGSSLPNVLFLPFIRNGAASGWYAVPINGAGASEALNTVRAWLGPTYLRGLDVLSPQGPDPMARALGLRFHGHVVRFSGDDGRAISERVLELSRLAQVRPRDVRRVRRPLGVVRAAFDRALLARDEQGAQALLAEIRSAGRLTQENLRFLEVRLQAGLGLWPQLARDHWTIKTLSDLALPPQTLSDLIEALYRTFVESAESRQNLSEVIEAFRANALVYARLFSSRHGVRAPRVLKAFMLHERLQPEADRTLLKRLAGLLPAEEQQSWLVRALLAEPIAKTQTPEASAETSFEEGQYDRAFELWLTASPSKQVFAKLLSSALLINDRETSARLLTAVDAWPAELMQQLPVAQRERLDTMRASLAEHASIDSWADWVEHLERGADPAEAGAARLERALTWASGPVLQSREAAQSFATALGNLSGEAARTALEAVPSLATAFFPDDPISPNAKPIAHTLLTLLAMEEALSRADLELIGQFLERLLIIGVSSDDYVSVLTDVAEVQAKIGSFTHLPWSIDLLEVLAVMPAPGAAQQDARLGLFMQVIAQAQGFSHRLAPQDWIALEYLLPDYGLTGDALDGLRSAESAAEPKAPPYLTGKVIGVYTLAEAAGARAKSALEALFPGVSVVVNSDKVCTDQLTALAEAADVFVFAWKSASHQAFYCVKNATMKVEPVWAPGKGTASIVRAVLDEVG